MIFRPNQLTKKERYKFTIGSVLPRPIAWVSSISAENQLNLAPYSYFTVASVTPFILMFAPQMRSDGSKKDTWRNIEAIPEFVVNITNETTAEAMGRSAAELPADQSEFAYAGVTPAASETISVPRVAEAPIAYECKLHSIKTFGETPGSGAAIFGEVTCIHIQDDLYEDGRISAEKLQPIGRLAGNEYTRITDRFTIDRD